MRSFSPTRNPGALAPTRAVLALAILIAAIATSTSLVRGPALAQTGGDPPAQLDGAWVSFANGDRVNRILRDGEFAWAATEGGGLVRWDLTDFSYRQFLAPQDGLASNDVYDVEIGADGKLWIATGEGLAIMDRGDFSVSNLLPENSPGMPARIVTALEPDPEGKLWVGFAQEWDPELENRFTKLPGAYRKGGLARYDPVAQTWGNELHAEYDGTPRDGRFKTIPSENVTEIEYSTDGSLWIGTRPFLRWDDSSAQDGGAIVKQHYWLNEGGGLAAYTESTQEWALYAPSASGGSCFGAHVTDIEADVNGRMWVATNGDGALAMTFGARRVSCTAQACYTRGVSFGGQRLGLDGNKVWAVDVDADGSVWMGHSESKSGRGIGVLRHNETFDDSSCSDRAAETDDIWSRIYVDNDENDSDLIVTAIELDGDIKLVGTKNQRSQGGFGLRAYFPAEQRWQPMRTGDTGLPSNLVRDIAHSPVNGDTWVTFEDRGVGRFDGERWTNWRMFAPGGHAAYIMLDSNANIQNLPVDIPDRETFDALFPTTPAYIRIGDDPVFYQVTRYNLPIAGRDATIRITPKLQRAAGRGTEIFTVDRGPASDGMTQVAVDSTGVVWAGGRETYWTGESCPSEKMAIGQCWLDGGLSYFDGDAWSVFNVDNSPLRDNFILSVAVDADDRVWAGMANGIASGYGVAVYNRSLDEWTIHDYTALPSGQRMGGNAASDISVDPQNGDVWIAQHSIVDWIQNLGGTWSRVFLGGGVGRWQKSTGGWSHWGKKRGARLRAHSDSGTDGEMTAILVDRGHDRIWAGSWDSEPRFHWIEGYGVNAVANYCPLESCTNEGWAHKAFLEDGLVSDMALDHEGSVWVGTHRNGAGLIPPVGGVKIFDEMGWTLAHPDDLGLVSNQITALEPIDDRMWVGTLSDGISVYDPSLEPTVTPSPRPSRTPIGGASATPTSATPGTVPPTATSAEVTPTTVGRTATPTRRPSVSCGAGTGRLCTIHIPFVLQASSCRRCPTTTALPSPVLFTATPTAGTVAPPTQVPSATPMPSLTPVPSPTETSTPTPTAGPSPTASRTPTPSATPAPSTTPTRTPSPSPTASATLATAPLGDWSVYTPVGFRLPTDDFYAVAATSPNDVWFAGANGKVLHWDGSTMNSAEASSTKALRDITLVSPTEGYIAGDEGTLLRLRFQRWTNAGASAVEDDWSAVSVIRGSSGSVGWVMGAGRGSRMRLFEGNWGTQSPGDRNTGHVYSAVAMVSESLAYALQGGTGGARIYSWNGQAWSPGPSTGPMFGLDVRSAGEAVAVGARGNAYWLEEGDWTAMPKKPATGGEDLRAVSIIDRDRIFAAGGRTGIYRWNGADWNRENVSGAHRSRDIHAMWIADDGSEGWAVGAEGLFLRYE